MTNNHVRWSGLAVSVLLSITLVLGSCSSGGDSGGSTGGGGTLCTDNCASQGACSSHQGVNCAAGPDSDGSVICNDGWRNSTVKYSCHS